MLAKWLLVSSALLLAPEAVTLRGATIVSYGADPMIGSGILMILRSVEVATPDGSRRKLYFIHAGDHKFLGGRNGEAYPAIGSTCDFSTVSRHVANDFTGDGGPGSPLGDVITDVHCNPPPNVAISPPTP